MKKKPDPAEVAKGARLKEARIKARFRSARAAALEFGWPESSYRAHEAGTRTIGQDDAERYMKRFRHLGVELDARYVLFGPAPARGRLTISEAALKEAFAAVLDALRPRLPAAQIRMMAEHFVESLLQADQSERSARTAQTAVLPGPRPAQSRGKAGSNRPSVGGR